MHLSLDIETLGTTPGSIILSVGFVAFDPYRWCEQQAMIDDGVEIFLSTNEQWELGMTEDQATLDWWKKQDVVARQHQFDEKHKRYKPAALASEIQATIDQFHVDRVWANGPAFDMVLLEELFRRAGVTCPWRYSWGRDIRTLGEITGTRPVVQGTAHNALHDAAAQAQFVQECYRAIFKL